MQRVGGLGTLLSPTLSQHEVRERRVSKEELDCTWQWPEKVQNENFTFLSAVFRGQAPGGVLTGLVSTGENGLHFSLPLPPPLSASRPVTFPGPFSPGFLRGKHFGNYLIIAQVLHSCLCPGGYLKAHSRLFGVGGSCARNKGAPLYPFDTLGFHTGVFRKGFCD